MHPLSPVRASLRTSWSALLISLALSIAGCASDDGTPSAATAPTLSEESLRAGATVPATSGTQGDLVSAGLPASNYSLELDASAAGVPEGGGEVTLRARLTGASGPVPGIVITFETTAGEWPDGHRSTTNDSGTARRVLRVDAPARVSAIVTAGPAVIARSNAIDLAVGIPRAVEFELSTSPRPGVTDAPTRLTIRARQDSGEAAAGALSIAFGDGRSQRLPKFDGTATVDHTYREPSTFNVIATLEVQGTEFSEIFPLKIRPGVESVLSLVAARDQVSAREPFRLLIRPRTDSGRRASGKVRIDWGDGRSSNLGEISSNHRIEHVYREPGSYRVTAELKDPEGQTSRAAVRVRVLDPITVDATLTASDSAPLVNSSVRFSLSARRSDGRGANGTAVIRFGDGSSTVASVSNSRATFSHTYTSTGSYNVSAAFDDGEGHQANANLGITVQSVPAPAPPQDPGDGGGSGGGGNPNDQLDVSQVVFLHADASSWPVTSTVTGTSISSGQICINHTKQGGWPVVSSIEGNPWIIANVGGTWYAGTYEWLRSGQSCKSMGVPGEYPNIAAAMGPHIKVSPLSTWRPKSGETVYLFVSTPARAGIRSIDERSNIVKVTWP